MRRYFDEYRGLRETIGHVEPSRRAAWRGNVRRQVAGDRRLDARARLRPRERARWTARSLPTTPAAACSRRSARAPTRLPPGRSSARSRSSAAARAAPGVARGAGAAGARPAALGRDRRAEQRAGRRRCWSRRRGMSERERLHIAVVIPPFARGSGGHTTIFQMLLAPRAHGPHLLDLGARPARQPRRRAAGRAAPADCVEDFAPLAAPVFKGFEHWYGADVVARHRVGDRLPGDAAAAAAAPGRTSSTTTSPSSSPRRPSRCGPSAPTRSTSTRSRQPWLRDLLAERYGRARAPGSASASTTTSTARCRSSARRRHGRRSTARDATPRRAVPLGLLALDELWRRRPERALRAVRRRRAGAGPPFPYEHLGRRHARRAGARATPRPPWASACRSPTTR